MKSVTLSSGQGFGEHSYSLHLIVESVGASLNRVGSSLKFFRELSRGGSWVSVEVKSTFGPSRPPLPMIRDITDRSQTDPPLFKRALESWPYVFITVSITGLAYIAIRAFR